MSSSLFLHLAKSPFQSLTHIQYSVYTNAKPRKRKLLQALPALDYYMCLQEFLQSPGGLTPPLSLSLIFVSSMQLCPWCNYICPTFVLCHVNSCKSLWMWLCPIYWAWSYKNLHFNKLYIYCFIIHAWQDMNVLDRVHNNQAFQPFVFSTGWIE
jgi:hypothetical protein